MTECCKKGQGSPGWTMQLPRAHSTASPPNGDLGAVVIVMMEEGLRGICCLFLLQAHDFPCVNRIARPGPAGTVVLSGTAGTRKSALHIAPRLIHRLKTLRAPLPNM